MKNILKLILLLTIFIQSFSFDENMYKVNETEHFIFYAQKENDYSKIYKCFENGFSKIITSLDIKNKDKFIIEIYPSEMDLIRYLSKSHNTPPSWNIGTYTIKENRIKIVDIDNLTCSKKEAEKIYLHEFTHYASSSIAPIEKNSCWLHEGLAVYENDQMISEYEIKILISHDGIIPISEIRDSFIEGGYYYTFAGLFTEYLIKFYGYDDFKTLLINHGDLEKTFSKTESELFHDWKIFLKNKYKLK